MPESKKKAAKTTKAEKTTKTVKAEKTAKPVKTAKAEAVKKKDLLEMADTAAEANKSTGIIADLLEKGKKNGGNLTVGEVVEALGKQDMSPDEIEALYDNFSKKGVEIADEAYITPEDLEKEEDNEVDVDINITDGLNIDDPVRMYLKEIGRVPLLTAEEEVRLATRMEDGVVAEHRLKADDIVKHNGGDNILTVGTLAKALGQSNSKVAHTMLGEDNEILKALREQYNISDEPEENSTREYNEYNAAISILEIPAETLTDEEIKKYKNTILDGNEAQKRLAEANLRLVVSIAKRYVGRGMLFLDLIQEGNLGLIKAVEKFDYTKGYKFSTYATWWIRQAISRALADHARTIRIPVHMVDTINKFNKIRKELTATLGREPKLKEIAAAMEIPYQKAVEIEEYSRDTTSLDISVNDEGDTSMGDLIGDDKAISPEAAAAQAMLRQHIEEALEELNPKEQEVLRLRFGLNDGRERTLDEIGKKFGVTRERIRQIEAKALKKLRSPKHRKKLQGYDLQ